jgi:predicted ATP-grasp superfamily ATP-dependent carboligase
MLNKWIINNREMTTLQDAITNYLKNNTSKQTVSLKALKDAVNTTLKAAHSQGTITEEIKKLGYELVKSSVANPFY